MGTTKHKWARDLNHTLALCYLFFDLLPDLIFLDVCWTGCPGWAGVGIHCNGIGNLSVVFDLKFLVTILEFVGGDLREPIIAVVQSPYIEGYQKTSEMVWNQVMIL